MSPTGPVEEELQDRAGPTEHRVAHPGQGEGSGVRHVSAYAAQGPRRIEHPVALAHDHLYRHGQ